MRTVDPLTTTEHRAEDDTALRRVIVADAGICAATGLALVVLRGSITELVGRDDPWTTAGIGAFFVLLGIGLTALSRSSRATLLRLAPWSADGDLLWATASVVAAATATLNGTGRALVLVQALAVAGVGAAKVAARRRVLVP